MMMAIASIALLGVLGMAVDIGRMFIAKTETQAYCDSAALAAALALDGTSTGISLAQTAVANSANTWNLNTTKVANPTLTFATSSSGPWSSNPSPATGYIYASVSATVPLKLYFIPVVVGSTTQNVTSGAVAAQVSITSFPQGLAPYSGVSTNTTPPNFGLVVGNSYDIQWPASNAGGFITPPCAGDSLASQQAVLNNWGSTSGYWGASSNSVIQQEILDAIQTEPLSVGTNIQPILTNGQKQSEAGYLDDRVNQDISTDLSNTPSGYMSSTHNGRRLLPVPIIDPTSTSTTTVIGYGSFLLLANKTPNSDYYKKNTNGNSAFCAIYAGPYQVGGISTGSGGSTGATYVKLIQ
jgi:Flp pilus assembly protein TadG